jgi:pseudouridylate synthase
MYLAHRSGISVFGTGGIGGVHRGASESFDISADLIELARTPVLVVCTGAKNILDLPKTLEMLETLSVPVIGYRTNQFPAFYLRESGYSVSHRVESPEEMAKLLQVHSRLDGGGILLTQPVSESVALDAERFHRCLQQAESEAQSNGIHGPALTPYLLSRLAELTKGDSLRTNQHLIVENARLAARVAVAYHREGG